VTKADFQKLADARIREAGILLAAGEFDGAYYIAGYAVEFALKACIIKRKLSVPESWPEKKFTDQCHTHDLEVLFRLADLDDELNTAGPVKANWLIVKEWSEQSRFELGKLEQDARNLYEAIIHAADGVLQWLKVRW
jgi:HEPN domain-containing protein